MDLGDQLLSVDMSRPPYSKEKLRHQTLAALQSQQTNVNGQLSRVKLHAIPDYDFKEPLLANKFSFEAPSEVFLECFYDTGNFALLGHGCWLRSRQVLANQAGSAPQSATEWVWQQESLQSGEIHVYNEYPATTHEEKVKAYMVAALPDIFRQEDPLHSQCPRLLARFVTARYHLSETACIDRAFFDEKGEDTYDVYTFFLGRDPLDLPFLTPAPTKIMEYLRRFHLSLYRMVQRHTQETKKMAGYTVEHIEAPEPSAFGEGELPWPTKAQLAQIPDPRIAQRRRESEEHQRKKQALIDERLGELIQTPGLKGKWVVLTEAVREPRHIAESELEAYKWGQQNIMDEAGYIVHVGRPSSSRQGPL